MNHAQTPDQGHAPRLAFVDGWRGLAILLVLVTHTWTTTGAPALSVRLGGREVVLAAVPSAGYVGVAAFLVVSGFCLSYPLLRDPALRGRTTVWQFWGRRVKRIVPAYYCSIIVVMLTWWAFRVFVDRFLPGAAARRPLDLPDAVSWADVWTHLAFVHNLWPDHAVAINSSYWTLALEFQLYLLFPLLLEAAVRWGPWRVLAAVLLIQVGYRLGLVAYLGTAVVWQEYEFVLPKGLFGRLFDFCAGVAAASVVAGARPGRAADLLRRPAGGAIGLSLVLVAFALHAWQCRLWTLTDLLWPAGFAALLCHSARDGSVTGKVMCFGPLAKLGVISYSVYLLHQPLMSGAGHIAQAYLRPGWAFVAGVLYLPLIVGAAALFFVGCEAPFLEAFKRRARGGRPAAQSPPVPARAHTPMAATGVA